LCRGTFERALRQSSSVTLARHVAGMLAEAPEQPRRRTFSETERPAMDREHRVNQCAPFGGQITEDDRLVLGACSPSHQAAFLELLDQTRGAHARHEDSVPNVTQGKRALVIRHLEHREIAVRAVPEPRVLLTAK
jgi:hypothetical protein